MEKRKRIVGKSETFFALIWMARQKGISSMSQLTNPSWAVLS